MEDWIDFYGGYCPVDEMVVVEAIFRNGEDDTALAGEFDWYHGNCEDDIVKYRIAEYDQEEVICKEEGTNKVIVNGDELSNLLKEIEDYSITGQCVQVPYGEDQLHMANMAVRRLKGLLKSIDKEISIFRLNNQHVK